MTPLKTFLALALACVACCALPLLGSGALLGAATLAAWEPWLAGAAVATAVVIAGLAWRRRRARCRQACKTDCGCSPSMRA